MFSAPKVEAWIGRVEDVLEVLDRIASFLGKTDRASFVADKWTVGALSYQILIIAEATKAMAPGLDDRHPAVAWKSLWGMRNIIAHEYGRVDPGMVWQAATVDLAPLRAAMLAEKEWLEGRQA
ncbi:MAG: DUF86 domain-containing protein [Actinomycetota bacterium]